MKAAIPVPISFLEEYGSLTNYHLCKSSLVLENKTYKDFYIHRKGQGDFVILDCSETEPRSPIFYKRLYEAAEVLKPNLVVAPDWDMNSSKTTEAIKQFLKDYGESLKGLGIGTLGMVQGATLDQCLSCYKTISKLVDAIGLPRSLEVAVGRSRFLKKIRTKKPIHIFGIQSSPEEELEKLLDLDRDNIFGISSDLPIRLGLSCRLLDEFRSEPPPLDYYSSYNPFPDFTKKNLEDFIDMAGG